MNKYDLVIAIDPDCDRSGVALLYTASRELEMLNMDFPALVDFLQKIGRECARYSQKKVVVVEAGYLVKGNWHTDKEKGIAAAAATGNNTGRNHEVARKIVELSRHYGIPTDEIKPLKKCWQGNNGKITHEELEYVVGHLEKHLNQEARDAALIAWVYAGFPVKVKPGNSVMVKQRRNPWQRKYPPK